MGNQLLANVVIGDDQRYRVEASRFVLALLCRQQRLPTVRQQHGAYQACWLPLHTEEDDARHVGGLITAMPVLAD